LYAVLRVYIIIHRTMYNTQNAFQLAGVSKHRAALIALGIALWGAHIPLGIMRVIKRPVHPAKISKAMLKVTRPIGKRVCSYVASVAAADNAYFCRIHV